MSMTAVADIRVAAAAAFHTERDKSGKIDRDFAQAEQGLATALAAMASQISKVPGVGVTCYRLGYARKADDMDRDGSYHRKQAYVLTVGSGYRDSGIHAGIIVEMHMGRLNRTEGKPEGDLYQSVYVVEAFDRNYDLRMFADYDIRRQAMQFLAQAKGEHINSDRPYVSYRGDYDAPEGVHGKLVQDLSSFIGQYARLLRTQPPIVGPFSKALNSVINESFLLSDVGSRDLSRLTAPEDRISARMGRALRSVLTLGRN